MSSLETKYGLPHEVVFCSRCVMSNQRPVSAIEIKHTKESRKTTMQLDDEGVCDSCRVAEAKSNIDWTKREEELVRLLDKYRKNDGTYDCLVPGSGGKDSAYQAHVLKHKYGMNPLTLTWAPVMYTDYGFENWKNWIEVGDLDNILIKPSGKTMKTVTRLSVENLLHPFQTFILGQKNIAPKVAAQQGISLIFYGENEAEYGNPIADTTTSLRDKSFHTMTHLDDIYLGGVSIKELQEVHGLRMSDLRTFLPPTLEEFKNTNVEVHYLGYYLNWIPQEVYYYAVENTGFRARPFRSEGTYSKYSSIDDKFDDLHWYTTYIKFGVGRATFDASQEVRNKHITREEASLLVKKFDGEKPKRYMSELMDYLDMSEEYFMDLCEKARSPHLWKKDAGEWSLRHTVNKDGVDD
jgi:N-acetyl sugar amidotransferase